MGATSGGGRRDRRGRGPRGPAVVPGGLDGRVVRPPRPRPRREDFDQLVLDAAAEIDARWADRTGAVEYAVEEAPAVPDDWETTTVPLATLVRGTGGRPPRIVVFRRPLEHRSTSRYDLQSLVLTVVVEQVADLLGLPPEDVDPRYEG